jgi:hypothetical protein
MARALIPWQLSSRLDLMSDLILCRRQGNTPGYSCPKAKGHSDDCTFVPEKADLSVPPEVAYAAQIERLSAGLEEARKMYAAQVQQDRRRIAELEAELESRDAVNEKWRLEVGG